MNKYHEIKSLVSKAAGINAIGCDEGLSVLVTGDKPELIPGVVAGLQAAGIPFVASKHTKFKGQRFVIPLKNVGTAFHASWEFA